MYITINKTYNNKSTTLERCVTGGAKFITKTLAEKYLYRVALCNVKHTTVKDSHTQTVADHTHHIDDQPTQQ